MDGLSNGPGMSIFQGSGELQLNPETQREEEEEAAADQQRRNEELHKLLTNAFDDLSDDEDNDQSTLNSLHESDALSNADENHCTNITSVADRYRAALFPNNQESHSSDGYQIPFDANNSAEKVKTGYNPADNVIQGSMGGSGDCPSVSTLHLQHCYRNSPGSCKSSEIPSPNSNDIYWKTNYNSIEQLQVLYEMRVREVKRLSEQLSELKDVAEHEKDELLRKLAFREAEKERAQLMYKEVQPLLVTSKEKISELEKEKTKMEAVIKGLEKTKDNMAQELECSRASITDLHKKILILERGNLNNTDKHMDAFFEKVQSMHNQQLKKVEDELSNVVSRLSRKELELEQQKKESECRIKQLENLLVDKGETVNQLARNLEDSQKQCQQLMMSGSGQEVGRLHLQLDSEMREKEKLHQQMFACKKEIEKLRSDLQHYEALIKSDLHDYKDGKRQYHNQEMHKQIQDLKEECSAAHQEANRRHEQIIKSEKELEETRRQLENEKEKYTELQKCLQEAESERRAAELAVHVQEDQNREMIEELKQLQQKLLNKNNTLESSEYLQFHEEAIARVRKECDINLKSVVEGLNVQLEEAKKECDRVKEMYITVCNSKKELVENIHKEELKSQELETQILKLDAELKTVSKSHQNKTLHQESIIAQLKIERDKLQSELKSVENLQVELKTQKTRTNELEAQNKIFIEKLHQGKENLEAAQKAITESIHLRAQLESQAIQYQHLKTLHEDDLKKLAIEKEHAVQEAEERAKTLYATKITEEIEKAKAEALQQFKIDWQEGQKELVNKLQKMEEEYNKLQERYDLKVHQYEQEISGLTEKLFGNKLHLSQAVQCDELDEREGKEEKTKSNTSVPLEDLKISTQNSTSDLEEVRRKLILEFNEKLSQLKTQHHLQLEESTERVKDETIRFCVLQIRQAEMKHRAELENCKQVCYEKMCKLQSSLSEAEVQLSQCNLKLKQAQESLKERDSKTEFQNKWKDKAKELEICLKELQLKAEEKEKHLESVTSKYHIAKKAVHKYKTFIKSQENHTEKEWQRINSGFRNTLEQVQQKLTRLLSQEDAVVIQNYLEKVKTQWQET